MEYPEYKFIGVKHKLDSQTEIIPLEKLVFDGGEFEFYTSIYRFDQGILQYPTLANLKPDVMAYSDYLIFDFDSKDSPKRALDDALYVQAKLKKLEAESQIWFSGGKGYHLYVPSVQFGFSPTTDADILKRMATAIAGELSTFDPSIYNKTRIFRYPYSFNTKGKDYKIPARLYHAPMSHKMVNDELKVINNTLYSPTDLVDYQLNPYLQELYESCKVKINRPVQEHIKEDNGTLFTKVKEGGRNEAAYTLSRKLARRSITQRDAEFIVKAWNNQLTPPLPEYEISRTVSSAYTKGINELVDETTYANHIYEIQKSISECSDDFNKQGEGAFFTGFDFFDKLSMGFYPGEVIGITARNSNFKTMVLENILQRGSVLSKKPVLMFSQEMPNSTLTVRRVQNSYDLPKKEAIQLIKDRGDSSKLIQDWGLVKTCYLSNLGIDEMIGLVDYYSETFGQLGAIGIDYLGLCKGTNNNKEKTARTATDLKTRLARAAKAPVFILTQAKQIYEGDKGSIELDRGCIKDSDTVIDSLDYSFGLWKKWGQVEDARDFLIFGKVLKDRGIDVEAWGEDPYFYLKMNKATMKLLDVVHVPNPPPFDQREKQHKEDF